jgi:hypothetical protein
MNVISRVTRIGPRQTRNILLMVGPRPSVEKQIRDFALLRDTYSDDMDAPMKEGDMNRWVFINKIGQYIVSGTLELKETIGNQSYFVFKARIPVGGSNPVELDGMLVYNATDNFVNTIELTYSDSGRPFESKYDGRIETFRLRVTYEKNKAMGANVPRDLSWAVTGRKGNFSKFIDNMVVTFSDYKLGEIR